MVSVGSVTKLLKDNGLPAIRQIVPLRQEASQRKYFRIYFDSIELQTAVICETLPIPDQSNDDFLYLSRFLKEQHLPVPEIYAVSSDGIILMSDAGEEDFSQHLKMAQKNTRAEKIEQIIDLIIQLQSIDPPDLVKQRSFDFDKLKWEMDFLLQRIDIPAGDHGLKSGFPSFEMKVLSDNICKLLADQGPLVFTHRDFHGRNIMVSDSYTMIDYQDARLGLPYYDLASFLYDPYTDFSSKERNQALDYYSRLTGTRIQSLFYVQAFQRIMKALGSYVFLIREKKQTTYKDSIEPALNNLETVILKAHLPDEAFLFVSDFRKYIVPELI